jgi:transposase-like protein
MGRGSAFTPVQKRDAVLGVLTKRKTVAETRRELGVIGSATFDTAAEDHLTGGVDSVVARALQHHTLR